jgi:hypothetical protein
VKNSAAGPAAARPRIVFIHRGVPPHMFSRDDRKKALAMTGKRRKAPAAPNSQIFLRNSSSSFQSRYAIFTLIGLLTGMCMTDAGTTCHKL